MRSQSVGRCKIDTAPDLFDIKESASRSNLNSYNALLGNRFKKSGF